MDHRKVLLLSRNPLVASSIGFLKKHSVCISSTVEKALDLISREKFDLAVVFDDIEGESLPTRAVEKIKKQNSMLPVIFIALTAQSMERARFCGADRSYLLQHAMSMEKDVICELCSYYESFSIGVRARGSDQDIKTFDN